MTDQVPMPEQAAKRFVELIKFSAYDRTIKAMQGILEQGPRGRRPPPEWQELHRWFQRLTENDRMIVVSLIRETVQLAVFNALAVLDGVAGDPPLSDRPSEFALYLQGFEDKEARAESRMQFSVRFDANETHHELHDLFQDLL